jgi:predicted P-loop ATPase
MHDPELLLQLLRKIQPNEEKVLLATPDGVNEHVDHPDWGFGMLGFFEDQFNRDQPILLAPQLPDELRTLHIVWKPEDMAQAKQQLREFCPRVAYAWEDGETLVAMWKPHDFVGEGAARERELARRKSYGLQNLKPQLSTFRIHDLKDAVRPTQWLCNQFPGATADALVPAPGSLHFNTGRLGEFFIFEENAFPYSLWDFDDTVIVVKPEPKRKKRKMDKDEAKNACTLPNIQMMLEMLGVVVARDVFANRTMIAGLDDFGPVLNDMAVNRLRFIASESFHMKGPEKDFFHDVLADLAWRNRFHPVCDYLDGVQPKWDGVKRIGDKDSPSWLTTYGGAEDNAYTRAVGPLQLIAGARRVRRPGCKKDEMLTFESAQGLNKSSALKVLAVREEWFCDNFVLGRSPRETQEILAGKWIVECAEMDGLSPDKEAAIKAALSRTHDKARAAYGRLAEETPRQCVFFGTINQTKYLTDTTGNRRHWPVALGSEGFDLEALKRDRDQLWAEAAAREAEGESIQLPEKLWKVAAVEQKARLAVDPWEERIAARLGDLQGVMRTSIVWNLLEIPVGNLTQKHGTRVGAIMKELGWIHGQKKVNGKVLQVYRRGIKEGEDEKDLWITTDYCRTTGRLLIQGGRLELLKKGEQPPVPPELMAYNLDDAPF